jgi:hypothetical protein
MADLEPQGPERFLTPFFRDSSLWPVLCVAVMIFVVLGAAALLMAFVERNLFAVGAVLLLFWISVDASIRARRRGRSPRLVIGIAAYWLLATGAALAARFAGWF